MPKQPLTKKALKPALSSWTNPDTIDIPDGFVRIGHVTRAHGIGGAVVVKFYADSSEQYGSGLSVRLHPKGDVLTVASNKPIKGGALVSFEEVTDRNTSETLRGNQLLMAAQEQPALDDDEYWSTDLVGMTVRDLAGTDLGSVARVFLGEAQDRLEIEYEGRRIQIPFVADLVPEVRLADSVVVVDLPDGLLVESSLEEE